MAEEGIIRGTDIVDSLQSLKDAIDVHFANIRTTNFSFAYDHANILKQHLDEIVQDDTSYSSDTSSVVSSVASLVASPVASPVDLLPGAIARFAPRATIDPPPQLGKLGVLPKEIREIIYRYALAPECIDLENCSCIRQTQQEKNASSLLMASGCIYNEAIHLLYESEVFGIQVGYVEAYYDDPDIDTWVKPIIYRQTTFGTQIIDVLPHNALRLIQHLEIEFLDDPNIYDAIGMGYNPIPHLHLFERTIQQICTLLKDVTLILHSLDITIRFGCSFANTDDMTRLIVPLTMLRSIKHPSLAIHAYEKNFLSSPTTSIEPRWHLHPEFEDFLYDLLRSPHGTPTPSYDHLEIFFDSFNKEDEDLLVEDDEVEQQWTPHPETWVGENHPRAAILAHEAELQMRNYLWDVYGTEDLFALNGGLPVRWQIFLNSEHAEECDLMDSFNPGHD